MVIMIVICVKLPCAQMQVSLCVDVLVLVFTKKLAV